MPKLRQPSTLEDLALGSLEKYVVGIIRCAVGETVSGITPPEICIDNLHKFLHADLPFTLSRKVTDRMFKLYKKCHILHEHENQGVQKVIKDVISASLSPHAEILHMTQLPKYVDKILIEYMHKFKKLHTLSCHLTGGQDIIGLFVSGLSSLKCLVKFQMKHHCTDAINFVLTFNNYETIELIDVTGSEDVTDASFKSLMKCHKLRALLIADTSMTAEGYVEFLQYKMSDDTASPFVYLSVGCLSRQDFSSRELDETAAMCPMLRELEIVNLRGNIGKLCNLTELEKVRIYDSDLVECNMDIFLSVRGSNLILLELMHVISIDFMCIVNHCVNLKQLSLSLCRITDIALGNARTTKSFLNLEKLFLIGEYPMNLVEHILSYCVHTRSMSLCLLPPTYVTDEIILRIFLLSDFRKLEYLYFFCYNNNLSIKSVNAIVEHCPLLEELSCLCSWRGVTNEQIHDLRKTIEDNNLHLWIDRPCEFYEYTFSG